MDRMNVAVKEKKKKGLGFVALHRLLIPAEGPGRRRERSKSKTANPHYGICRHLRHGQTKGAFGRPRWQH